MRADKSLKIPATDPELLQYAANWDGVMGSGGSNYAAYGLATPPTAIHALYLAFEAAYGANQPPNRSETNTAALRTARKNLLDALRPLYNLIAAQPFSVVSAVLKTALRVNPGYTKKSIAGEEYQPRTKIGVADSAPRISIRPTDNLTVQLTYQWTNANLRSANSKKRSSMKPVGAASCQFFYKLTAPGGANPYSGLVPMCTLTRSPSTFKFDPSLGGRTVYVCAKWYSAKGEPGAFSGFLSCTVPIEGVSTTSVPVG
jgi:hypothetical protein